MTLITLMGVTHWMVFQGSVKAFTCGGAVTSLLVQQLDGFITPMNYIRMAARVFLAVILSADEVLFGLGTFSFAVSHLFSAGGRHPSSFAKLLRFI